MRQVGSLSSEVDARRLAAYLVQQNIDAIVEHGSDQWIIWVRNEDQRNDARASFQHFVANPQDARYQQAEKSVEFERHETVRPKPHRSLQKSPGAVRLVIQAIGLMWSWRSWSSQRSSLSLAGYRVVR